MRDYRDAKLMARSLRENLKGRHVELSLAESLELVAKQFGYDNWNVLAAKIDTGETGGADNTINLSEVIPVIRMFDVAKAVEFYCDFLGFKQDWRGEIFPGAVKLHLSEHHGDAAPGGTSVVNMTGIKALHAELIAKNYKYNRPALEETSYGATVMHAIDPFGNRLRFTQAHRV